MMRRLFLSPVAALASPLDARPILVTVIFCVTAAFVLGLAPAVRLTTRRAISPGHSAAVRPSRALDRSPGCRWRCRYLLNRHRGALRAQPVERAPSGLRACRTEHVAVVRTNTFEVGRPMESHAIHRQMQQRIARLPQVESSAVIDPCRCNRRSYANIDVPGRESPKGSVSSDDLPLFNSVDPSYFTVMRMRLIQGRLFTDEDNQRRRRGRLPWCTGTDGATLLAGRRRRQMLPYERARQSLRRSRRRGRRRTPVPVDSHRRSSGRPPAISRSSRARACRRARCSSGPLAIRRKCFRRCGAKRRPPRPTFRTWTRMRSTTSS